MPRAFLVVVVAAALAGPAFGADEEAAAGALNLFVEELARGLEQRATLERVAGPIRIDMKPMRGIDAHKAERSFLPRLRKRLKDGGVLTPSVEAPLRCRLTLSEEGGMVWATALLESAALVGPTAVAASHPVDKELEVVLGAVVKPAQTRFSLERLGTVPGGVLDAMLVDIDGDNIDEIVLLSVDGLRITRAAGPRLERAGGVHRLPSDRGWPRVATGWLAEVDTRIWLVTSAGHTLLFDPRAQRFEPGPRERVPLRGAMTQKGPLVGKWRFGSPLVMLPPAYIDGSAVRAPPLPRNVRDLATAAEGFVVVDEDGQLLSYKGDATAQLTAERVGDRITLVDLEGDGEAELVTTSASAPGEPDHLVLRRLDASLSTSTVVFRSPLSGGAIVASAAGRLDFGQRPDVILVEDVGKEALVWRLRYAP